jgi:hypothetical protein
MSSTLGDLKRSPLGQALQMVCRPQYLLAG